MNGCESLGISRAMEHSGGEKQLVRPVKLQPVDPAVVFDFDCPRAAQQVSERDSEQGSTAGFAAIFRGMFGITA